MPQQTAQERLHARLKNFTGSKTFKYLLFFLIVPVLIAYLVWEIYWYSRVNLLCVKWHTHLAFPVYLFLIGNLIIRAIGKRTVPSAIPGLITAYSSLIFTLFIVEVMLMVSDKYKTNLEKQLGYYYSQYQTLQNKRYHIWTTTPHFIEKKEFVYWRPTNNEGLADSNWTTTSTPGTKRIMAIGDSFTEGDGAPFDSTYPVFLKQNLLKLGDSIYMMNAGVCGSDPFYNYIHLKEKLLLYKPDIIIQTLSSSDIENDFMTRGGLERFNGPSVSYRTPPIAEPLYAISYVSRIFYHAAGYNELFLKPDAIDKMRPEIDSSFTALFNEYSNLCRQKGIKLVVVLRPDINEIVDNAYSYDLTTILTGLKADKDITVIDLLGRYKNYIQATNTRPGNYYWQLDKHHNAKGYQMLATVLTPDIHALLIDTIP